MPRKAALIAEDSTDSMPDSPLRRSSRTRVVSSPAPQAVATPVGRTRRNSTSSVDSVISVSSTASQPAATKPGVRVRRPSLTQESNLEKIGEDTEHTEHVTPAAKRTRRGSISSVQEDDATTARAGSPAVGSVSDRRRSLRSASRSPTSESKATNESQVPTVVGNGTPSKVRGRRASAEKTAPKRRGSIALEVLDEEHEPTESPMQLKKLKSVIEESEQEQQKRRLSIDEKNESKENPNKKRLSSETVTTKPDEEIGSSKPSESSTKSSSLEKENDVSNVMLGQRMRDQILARTKVVISPLLSKVAPNEAVEIISEDNIETHSNDLINNGQSIESTEKTDGDGESIGDLEKSVLTEYSETKPVNQTFEEVKISPSPIGSPKRTHYTSKSPVRRSPRLLSEAGSDSSASPNRKLDSSPIIGRMSSSIDSSKIITPVPENRALEISSAKNQDESKEIVDGSDGSFNLSLKSSILTSQEELRNKSSDELHKESKKDELNISNESDKENTAVIKASPIKRVSNVFRSKNIEESFFESMDIDYPSDNDESLTVKQTCTNKTVRQEHTASDDSCSGSLHLICSDDDNKTVKPETSVDNRQSIALIQFDKSVIVNDCKAAAIEAVPKATFLLDSRISILPCKVLTPVQTESIEKNIADANLQTSPEFDNTTSSEEQSCTPNDKKSTVVDESSPVLLITTENEDGLTNKEIVSQMSPIVNKSLTKRTTPIRLAETSKRDSTTKLDDGNKNDDADNGSEDSDDEAVEAEEEPVVKFSDLVVADSQDSSDPEYCPNSDEGKVETDENDSCPDIATDEMSAEDAESDAALNKVNLDTSHSNKSPAKKLLGANQENAFLIDNSLSTKRIVELQSITIMSSNSSAHQSSDSQEEQTSPSRMKKLQSITIKSSSVSESDSDSKLRQLIMNKTAEYNSEDTDSSDSDYKSNQYVDDEAMEVSDEDTPSDDSNEIIDVGDNIEDTDDELEDDDVFEQSDDDFIDDNVVDLLSGNEDKDDLEYDGKEVVTRKKKRKILIRPVDENEESDVEENKAEANLETSVSKSRKKRNSSISVSEIIKKDEVVTSEISENITDIVGLFCARISDQKGGSVRVNMSLDYDESSSNDEESQKKKPNVSINTSAANISLKHKTVEPADACDSSTSVDVNLSKVKVLQEVRISDNMKPQPQEPEGPSSKRSKKNKQNRSHNKSNDDVFLPDSSNISNSTRMQTTPRPTTVCPLPDNIISQLVNQEQSLSKSNAQLNKKRPMPVPLKLNAEEYKQYSKPSTSHGLTNEWAVSVLSKQSKPSKHNRRKTETDLKDMLDPKDFKNYMIAKSKPKVTKKSFKESLKTHKKF